MTGLRARLLAEGRHEMLQDIFIRLLSQRFGALDEATLVMINQASSEELTQWIEKLMDSRSLDEVFKPSR